MAFLTKIAGGGRTLGRRAAWLVGLALLGAVAPEASAQTVASKEYQLKAVFLFNFAQFVEWPARSFREADAPLVIGVLGEDPFGAYLDELVTGEKIGNRPLIVRRYKRVEDTTDCHILFVSRSEAEALGEIVAQLKSKSVLTVSDADTFNQKGGMVRLLTENGKIRFKIHVEAAKACELTPSSKILSPATIFTPGKD